MLHLPFPGSLVKILSQIIIWFIYQGTSLPSSKQPNIQGESVLKTEGLCLLQKKIIYR